jgi:DNA repair protein RecO (recombination protein O)
LKNGYIKIMENWQDQGVVLRTRAHGEAGAVVTLLTEAHGRHAGYLQGGQSSRHRSAVERGNLVSVHWRGKGEDELGNWTVEPERNFSSALLGDPLKLGAMLSACALCDAALPEREGHPGLFHGLLALMEALDGDYWGVSYVMWEIAFLRELGFSLNMSRCVAGGSGDLVWVSPKSGGAVSAEKGEAYKDKLLALPEFLKPVPGGGDMADVLTGLRLTGHFLEHWAFAQHTQGVPEERRSLQSRVEHRVGS